MRSTVPRPASQSALNDQKARIEALESRLAELEARDFYRSANGAGGMPESRTMIA